MTDSLRLMHRFPPAEHGHGADDKGEDIGFTRLEAAEQERRSAIRAELEQHRMNTDSELGRHRMAMDKIAIEFGMHMGVA
jgi:hypothetical protein